MCFCFGFGLSTLTTCKADESETTFEQGNAGGGGGWGGGSRGKAEGGLRQDFHSYFSMINTFGLVNNMPVGAVVLAALRSWA